MNYKIRKAEENDLEFILKLGRKIVDRYERTHLGDEIADSYIHSGASDDELKNLYDKITLIEMDEKIAGLIICEKNQILGFMVDIPYWGTGIAQILLEYAIQNIFSDYEEINLECFASSPRANAFYKKMGFKSEGLVGCDENMIFYSKKI